MDPERGRELVEIARQSVEHAVLGTPEPNRDDAWLLAPGATFVTLWLEGRLRGCLGTLEAHLPLIDDLRSNARAAATRDPRFPPVSPTELPEVEVEVSVLSPLEAVPCRSEEEALEQLVRGQDGWVLAHGSHKGTFLPQVWDTIPEPRRFLQALKEKAGLARDRWDPEMRLWRYRVEKWAVDPGDPRG